MLYLLTLTMSRRSIAFIRICLCVSVCLFVRPHDRTKTAETTIFKLATGIMSPGYPFNIRSKGQRSRSQGHKVQKHISGDRVAGMSLHSIEWPRLVAHVFVSYLFSAAMWVDEMLATHVDRCKVAASAWWIIVLQVVDDDNHVLNVCINDRRSDGQSSSVGRATGLRHCQWAGSSTGRYSETIRGGPETRPARSGVGAAIDVRSAAKT